MEKTRQGTSPKRWGNMLENIFIVVLAFYPLRHISRGLDLWDTGYNYANFQYMGTEHMDPMWLFSTYLANVAGNFLTGLPNADTLMGMNLYTGLFPSLLALSGYFFCTRKLKMPRGIVFAGEFIALNLCWCPTALLYNYLTYLFFLIAVILLYYGLTGEKKACFVCAGILLGTNVLVRFSNLPEAGMIAAVWAYDFIVWREGKKGGLAEGFWKRTLRHTLWCLMGYVGALAVLLNYIHICYGIDEYIAGIGRLFAMTETATDYKASSMILGMVKIYVEELYWVIRFGAIIVCGMILFVIAGWMENAVKRLPKNVKTNSPHTWAGILAKALHIGIRVLWTGACALMLWWLYKGGFWSLLFYSYDPIWHPGTLLLLLTMGIAGIRILCRNASREEKLISGMVILIILLTPIGSNNGVFPALNNLFLAAPYLLWESWRFVRGAGDWEIGKKLVLPTFPAKGILMTFLGLCFFLFTAFGLEFVFAEATGVQDAEFYVYNNEVLKNIRMDSRKAQWMSELSEYANEDGLKGKEVILYGKIPALSYYLQMPAAFNPWSDLDSYSPEVMEGELKGLEGLIREKGAEKPVIILENAHALYLEEKAGSLSLFPLSEKTRQTMAADSKWNLLMEFMEDLGYEQTFRNEKFAVYR